MNFLSLNHDLMSPVKTSCPLYLYCTTKCDNWTKYSSSPLKVLWNKQLSIVVLIFVFFFCSVVVHFTKLSFAFPVVHIFLGTSTEFHSSFFFSAFDEINFGAPIFKQLFSWFCLAVQFVSKWASVLSRPMAHKTAENFNKIMTIINIKNLINIQIITNHNLTKSVSSSAISVPVVTSPRLRIADPRPPPPLVDILVVLKNLGSMQHGT